jgi:hypothetical protein
MLDKVRFNSYNSAFPRLYLISTLIQSPDFCLVRDGSAVFGVVCFILITTLHRGVST